VAKCPALSPGWGRGVEDPINSEELRWAIDSLKEKAPGNDGITANIIKGLTRPIKAPTAPDDESGMEEMKEAEEQPEGETAFFQLLLTYFNWIFIGGGRFSEAQLRGVIIPIYKGQKGGGDTRDYGCYRREC